MGFLLLVEPGGAAHFAEVRRICEAIAHVRGMGLSHDCLVAHRRGAWRCLCSALDDMKFSAAAQVIHIVLMLEQAHSTNPFS